MTRKPKPSKPVAVDVLTEKQAKAEYARLQAEIAAHDRRYYQEDAPTVSDAEYDRLRRRYDAIEARFPDLRTLESLSLKVGAAPARGFAKVRHRVPMLSLDNAFSEEDVRDFVERIRRFLRLPAEEPVVFSAEPKIDGLSMSLRYESGELVTAATRGDGTEGERPRRAGRSSPIRAIRPPARCARRIRRSRRRVRSASSAMRGVR